jgi:hypothetical protein
MISRYAQTVLSCPASTALTLDIERPLDFNTLRGARLTLALCGELRHARRKATAKVDRTANRPPPLAIPLSNCSGCATQAQGLANERHAACAGRSP